MTRNEIIEAAWKSGVWIPAGQGHAREQEIDRLERFAELVAAAEREARVKAIENSVDGLPNNSDWADGYIQAANDIADGIRARGES